MLSNVRIQVYASLSRDNLKVVKPVFAVFAPAAVLLVSCGGGGATQEVHPATSFRVNNVGDSWTYSVAIDFGQFGAYKGTMTDALTSDTYSGQPSVRDTQTFNLALKTGPAVLTSFSEISAQGALLATTLNDVLYPVTGDTFHVASTIGPTTNDAGVISISTGETLTETYKVIGAERMATPAGTFNCWIVLQKVVYSTGASDDFAMWIAPEIGSFVRITDKTINADGSGYTYTAVLTSANPAPSAGKPPVGVRLIRSPLSILSRPAVR